MEPIHLSALIMVEKTLKRIKSEDQLYGGNIELKQSNINVIGSAFYLAKSEKQSEFSLALIKLFKKWLLE